MKILVFSGTTEGKEIAGYLSELQIDTTVSVATEYGKDVMEQDMPYITIHVGRMDYEEMLSFAKDFQLIIDATHPYARLVTENIKKVAETLNIEYIRLLRPDTSFDIDMDISDEKCIHVPSVIDAVEYLKNNVLADEKIFISTGSKELDKYIGIKNYQDSLIVRVLPAKESEEKCKDLMLKNVIYEKGPFTLEQNLETFSKYNVKWLVTKSAGKAGGFDEKLNAAKQLDITTVIIDRPQETGGMDMETVRRRLVEIKAEREVGQMENNNSNNIPELQDIVNDTGIEIVKPMDIEKKSFEIITQRLNGRTFGADKDDIVKRVIHTSADFDYADNLVFSENVVEKALEAIKNGATIVTDTNMAFSGINKNILASFGGQACCYMADEDVAAEAKKRGITRAMVSMEKACELTGPVIFAIGNAPTALIWIDRLVKSKKLNPSLVIGVPVGFVNVVESKELIINSDIPHIVARGNKGGSNVAAAICNALLYKLKR